MRGFAFILKAIQLLCDVMRETAQSKANNYTCCSHIATHLFLVAVTMSSQVEVEEEFQFLTLNCSSELVFSKLNCDSLEHPEWGDVVRKLDGSVQHPIELDIYFVIGLTIFVAFAFPPNVEIIFRILCNKNYRRKPRYIIKLFMTFSSLFTLFTNYVQISHVTLRETSCRFFVAIFAVSYAMFLFNLLMMLIECFVWVKFPLWHAKNVTPRCVFHCLVGLNFIPIMALKWMFIGRKMRVVCAIQAIHELSILLTFVSLFIFLFFFLTLDFVVVWQLLPQASETVPVSSINHNVAAEEIEMDPLNVQVVVNVEQQNNLNTSGNALLRRLEMEAIKSLLISLLPLFFLLLPPLLAFSFHLAMCRNKSNSFEICNQTWIYPYSPVVMTIHALVSPILSLRYNKDFASPCIMRQLPAAFFVSACCSLACFLFNVITFL